MKFFTYKSQPSTQSSNITESPYRFPIPPQVRIGTVVVCEAHETKLEYENVCGVVQNINMDA